MTFIKATYSEDQLQNKINEIRNSLELPLNYNVVSITGCNTNGQSIYVKVLRDGEDKPVVFRVSNHANGNSELVADMGTSYQIQGLNINAMRVFYGEITKEESRISFLIKEIAKAKDKGQLNTIKLLSKELNKLTK